MCPSREGLRVQGGRRQHTGLDRTPDLRRQRGRQAERLACRFLLAQGFVIEETNVRFPVGEIDIVARERDVLCFVEVRSRASAAWGGPLASITGRKRRHLIRAARWYLARVRPDDLETRFDVVAIDWQPDGDPAVQLIRGAFSVE